MQVQLELDSSLVRNCINLHQVFWRAQSTALTLRRTDQATGTGHSSLSHLRDFPVDVVKIDRSFVEKMTFDAEVRAIVQAVLDLCGSLKIDVVAEGIETEVQRRLLLDDGCTLGQGFYFGKAIEADQVPDLFAANAKRLVA